VIRGTGLILAVVAATGVLFAASAVGDAAELDSKRLAKQVAVTVGPSFPDLPVTTVTCPKKIPRKAATTVICDVDASGYSLEFKVTQTDRKGNVTIESTQAVIPKAKAEELVRNNATLPVTVDCGDDNYIVRPPGFPFSCTARFDDGTVQQVTVSPTDVAGNATITQVL
jgi:Domain of unknown function (DUF4333)